MTPAEKAGLEACAMELEEIARAEREVPDPDSGRLLEIAAELRAIAGRDVQ